MDEEVRISIRGLPPREDVLLRAATEDDDHRHWSSAARFRTRETGHVDLARAEPRTGSYRGAQAMGLLWSMRLAGAPAKGSTIFVKSGTSPNIVRFEAEVGGRIVSTSELTRIFLAPGTEERDLDGNGHVARLFLPPKTSRSPAHERFPAIIVLSGSGGGFDLDKAAVLSRHGFAALALAYFGVPPLPGWLHRIPLDYFEAALGWLAAQPEIDPQRTGVLGVSRGAELALLLGATIPQIRTVVAFAPSSVAWAAGGREKTTGEIIPSWTWRGEPVPFAPLPLRRFMWRSAIPVAVLRRPVMFRNLFRAGLRDREAVERAAIPVERIGGPVLLVSGGEDHVWPAKEMSDAIVARLDERGFPHAVEHWHYPRAGHMLRYPFLPTTSRQSSNPHLGNARYSFGGSASADAEAQADSWRRAIGFLGKYL